MYVDLGKLALPVGYHLSGLFKSRGPGVFALGRCPAVY